MKIPAIKSLVETYSLAELQEAEIAILEEQTPAINVEGADEGEQLTHVMGAIFIKGKMEKDSVPFNQALREYTLKVRNSIS